METKYGQTIKLQKHAALLVRRLRVADYVNPSPRLARAIETASRRLARRAAVVQAITDREA